MDTARMQKWPCESFLYVPTKIPQKSPISPQKSLIDPQKSPLVMDTARMAVRGLSVCVGKVPQKSPIYLEIAAV